MKITKRQLRKIIREERVNILKEQYDDYIDYEEVKSSGADPSVIANKLLDSWMTQLENKLYKKYPDDQVDSFAVEAMQVVGKVESLLLKLITGGYADEEYGEF